MRFCMSFWPSLKAPQTKKAGLLSSSTEKVKRKKEEKFFYLAGWLAWPNLAAQQKELATIRYRRKDGIFLFLDSCQMSKTNMSHVGKKERKRERERKKERKMFALDLFGFVFLFLHPLSLLSLPLLLFFFFLFFSFQI